LEIEMKCPYDISWNGRFYPEGSEIENPQLIAALGGAPEPPAEQPAEVKPKAKIVKEL
jgi:hypothetical protein